MPEKHQSIVWCKYTADDDIGKQCSVRVNREILRIGCKHSVPKTKRELRYNGLQSAQKMAISAT